jgi:hypothetical protein
LHKLEPSPWALLGLQHPSKIQITREKIGQAGRQTRREQKQGQSSKDRQLTRKIRRAEKNAINAKAAQIAGASNVKDEIAVTPKS